MVWDVSFTCDVCGKKKGEANHWWMLALGESPCDEEDQPPQRFAVMPWSGSQSRDAEMRHLCGKGCAMQALERFMTAEAAPLDAVGEDEVADDEAAADYPAIDAVNAIDEALTRTA